jgi:hypothetical protein
MAPTAGLSRNRKSLGRLVGIIHLDVSLANDASIVVILFAESPEVCAVPPHPLKVSGLFIGKKDRFSAKEVDDKFLPSIGYLLAGVNQPMGWETMSFGVLAGAERPNQPSNS